MSESQNRCYKKTKQARFSEKRTFLISLYRRYQTRKDGRDIVLPRYVYIQSWKKLMEQNQEIKQNWSG